MRALAYADPRGRIGRIGYAIGLAILLPPTALLALVAAPTGTATLWTVLQVALVWLGHCLIAKRLHDCGVSGWWSIGGFFACCVWTAAAAILLMLIFGFGAMAIGQTGNVVLVAITQVPIATALVWLALIPGENGPNRHGPKPAALGCVMPWQRRPAPVALYG